MIAADEIHLWPVPLDLGSSVTTLLAQCLAPDEVERAGRLRRERDRRMFVARRGVLRLLLAGYLETAPGAVRFRVDQYGKPVVAADSDELPAPHFSVSSSSSLALYGFASQVPLGVDVEWVERRGFHDDVARRYFTASEEAELREFPEAERGEAFFRCWTRKEAYVKARGEGLSHPLDDFDVSLAATGTRLLRRVHGSRRPAASWTLATVVPAPGFVAAVAAPRPGLRLAMRAMHEAWPLPQLFARGGAPPFVLATTS